MKVSTDVKREFLESCMQYVGTFTPQYVLHKASCKKIPIMVCTLGWIFGKILRKIVGEFFESLLNRLHSFPSIM